jgi:cyclic pyranopterin phosphate synthase
MRWHAPSLEDLRGRSLRYVRISVTERCQFRCPYCRPESGEEPCDAAPDYLTAKEIGRVARVLSGLGIKTVRFTGGEPLLRRDLAQIVGAVREVGVTDLALTTNAALLTLKRAKELAEAGLKRINISFDTLDENRFKRLSGGAPMAPVLAGIEAVGESGMRLKTNTVVLRDENESELLDIARFVWARGGVPRFIEVMPMGAGADLTMVPAVEILAKFDIDPEVQTANLTGGIGPADYWLHEGRRDQPFGVIAATTRNFCAACNRIRLTATGEVRACLASAKGTELRPILRNSTLGDQALVDAVCEALAMKPEGHRFSDGIPGETPMRLLGG